MPFDIEFRAIERERRRVAKELHDEVLPSLARLIRTIQSQDSEQRYGTLVDELHNTVGAFRDLLGELHPVDLEELGLVPALNNICHRYARLTGLCVVFIERTEDCPLSQMQQLCLYRAIQAALRMFAQSENDILIVSYESYEDKDFITVRCVDKRVSSAEWLSIEKEDFSTFESWCAMAGAKVQLGSSKFSPFPCDLVISVAEKQPSDDQERIELTRDQAFFENLAIAAERARISDDIDKLIRPRLVKLATLAAHTRNEATMKLVTDRLQIIIQGVMAVMSEDHARLMQQSGLVSSIRTLVERFMRASQIETTIIADLSCDDMQIPVEAKFEIYRVTQEALNNIEKHSSATLARVSVRRSAQGLAVHIEDNGKGFQVRRSTQSRGLKIIKERAAAAGAEVTWSKSTSFPTGTLLTISLPSQSGPKDELGCSPGCTCGAAQSAY